jgi:hypothetical protein
MTATYSSVSRRCDRAPACPKERASYNQAEYLEGRKAMMQQWADTIDSLAKDGKVRPIKRAAA